MFCAAARGGFRYLWGQARARGLGSARMENPDGLSLSGAGWGSPHFPESSGTKQERDGSAPDVVLAAWPGAE